MNIANPLPAKLPVKIHPTKSSTATDYATLGICASQPTQPKPTEARRPRILLAKRLPEDYFGQDSVYVAPGAKTVPITLIRPNQNFGPLKSSTGTLIEHTVLGDVDDFEEFDKLYSKSLPNLDEKADIIKNQELPITKHAEVNNENQKNDEKVSSNVEQTDERKEWLQKLHIFQKYREMREENALSNWKRHSIEWSRIEERIGKSIKKPADELLMARLGEYREFVEERDLIEEALMLLEEHNVNFWKTGLRLGSDLLGLCFQMPSGGPRQQERLRTYELYNAKKTKKPSEYQEYRKKELEQVISHLDPFSKHDDGGYLEVVGRGTQDNSNVELTKEYMERLDRRASCKSMQTLGTQPTTRAVTPKLYTHSDKECSDIEGLVHGMQLMFSTKRMYFSVLLDQVATSVLTIHNCGTVAIHFTWVLMRHKNPLQVSAIYDNAQRFYMNYPSGVILPGTAYDFPIIFKSNTPGLFTELWTLETHPAMSHQQDLTITLQGLAIEKNNYQQKCLDIEQLINRRYAQTVATKVIDKILSNINKGLKPKPYALDPNHTSFELRNKDMKIRFQQHIYDQLVLLANSTFHILGKQITWDNSLVNLYEFMLEINQADIRSQHIEKLNSLVHEATLVTTTPRHSMLSALCYDMLIDIACKVSDNSDQLRSQMGLPLARSAAKFTVTDEVVDDISDRQAEVSKPTNFVADAAKKTGVSGPPVAAPVATDSKRAPPIATPAPAKDAKKGLVTAAPVKPVEPPKKNGLIVKKLSEVQAVSDIEETVHQTIIPKAVTKKRAGSHPSWKVERRLKEDAYIAEFRSVIRSVVLDSIDRLCGLFDEVTASGL